MIVRLIRYRMISRQEFQSFSSFSRQESRHFVAESYDFDQLCNLAAQPSLQQEMGQDFRLAMFHTSAIRPFYHIVFYDVSYINHL